EYRFRLLIRGLVDADAAVRPGPLRRIRGLAGTEHRAAGDVEKEQEGDRQRRGAAAPLQDSQQPTRHAPPILEMAKEARSYSRPRGTSNTGESRFFSPGSLGYQGRRRRPQAAAGSRLMGKIVWLASYPKSGNTWLRAFLHNLLADPKDAYDINALDTFC